VVKKNWLALCNMVMETALPAVFEPCLALPHMQEYDAVKKNNEAGGLNTDNQTEVSRMFQSIPCRRLPPSAAFGFSLCLSLTGSTLL